MRRARWRSPYSWFRMPVNLESRDYEHKMGKGTYPMMGLNL
jgi:hypothetical protein